MPALGPPGALSPRDWNARVDYDQWRDLFSPDDGVALHHGGGSDYPAGRAPFSRTKEISQLQSWEAYHIDRRGWRGLAYGWAVGQTGTIYRARGWASYGAHTGDIDGDGISNNAEIVPIIFIGSGNHHDLSPDAQASIERLRRFIEEGSPNATYLYGHQEISTTTCPGPKGMAYVTAHRLLEEEDMAKIPLEWWAKDAFKWAIDNRLYTEETNLADVREEYDFQQLVVMHHRYHNKFGGQTGAHHHDGRYVRDVTVSK